MTGATARSAAPTRRRSRTCCDHTDHKIAPWTLVAAESKAYARVAVVEAVIDALEQGMRAAGQEPGAVEAAL